MNEQERRLQMVHMDAINVIETFKEEAAVDVQRPLAWHMAYYDAEQESERTGRAHVDYRRQLQSRKVRA
jgi:hypothetical protein